MTFDELLGQIRARAEKAKPNEAHVAASFLKSDRDYWEAHAQFGSDPSIRLRWYHDVGYDAGFEAGLSRTDVDRLLDVIDKLRQQRNIQVSHRFRRGERTDYVARAKVIEQCEAELAAILEGK